MTKKALILFLLLVALLVAYAPSVLCTSNQIGIFADEEFTVNLQSDEDIAVFSKDFNFTLPPYKNATIFITYDNTIENIKYETCYIKEVTILIDRKVIFTKQFNQNVQGFEGLSTQLLVTPSIEHEGTLTLVGVSEGIRFYGTFSLSIDYVTEGNGFWLPSFNWRLFDLDILMLLLIFGVPTGAIAVLLIRRRRSREA